MDEKDKLIISWIKREITKSDFLKGYTELTNQHIIDDNYCLGLITEAAENKDADKLEEALTIGFTIKAFSTDFSKILCRVLQENWHYSHENIASILKDLQDPSTVSYLFEAAQLNFEYLEYDDTYQFARKCIKALAAIDDEEAIGMLRALLRSKNPHIGEYAAKELRYKGL